MFILTVEINEKRKGILVWQPTLIKKDGMKKGKHVAMAVASRNVLDMVHEPLPFIEPAAFGA